MTTEPPEQAQFLDPAPQFSLRMVFIIQAVCAVFFAILVICKIFAVSIAVAATLIFARVRVHPEHLPFKRLLVDLLGGIFLPALCLYYDPLVFTSRRENHFLQVFGYTAIGLQMTALLVWLFGQWRLVRLSGLFSGIFFAGALMALVCGLVLLPISIFGLLVLIGLAGFTPFITFYVFIRHFLQAKKIAYCQGRIILVDLSMLLGFFLAIFIPCLIYLVCGEYVVKIIEHFPWPRHPL
jgi:hypothetical protein